MEDGERRISFIKDVEKTADTIYSTLSNEIEKCGGVEFESDGATVINGHKKASKLKRDNPKIISIHCHNNRLLTFQCFPFFIFFKKKYISYEKKIII